MKIQNVLTQTLYAQLREDATIFDSVVFENGSRGSHFTITKDGRTYHYWQISTPSGIRKLLIGRESEETRATVERMHAQRAERQELFKGLQQTARAFLASGGMSNEPAHFRVMDKLASAGLFRKGLVLVGSHAFVALGNALGVRWGSHIRTTDMDLARAQTVALAVPDDTGESLLVLEEARKADESFFLVPELNPKEPSSTIMSRRTKVKLDFLTVQRGRDRTGTQYFSDIGIAAIPLKFMDYLLAGPTFKGLIVGNYAIPVTLPDPARFAIHKLIIAQERVLDRDVKAIKDVQQANEVLQALVELGKDADIEEALERARTWSGAMKNIKTSLGLPRGLSEDIRQRLKQLTDKPKRP